MKEKVAAGIATLKAERDELVRQANLELAARGAVIAELERLIAEPPAASPAEEPTEEPEKPTA